MKFTKLNLLQSAFVGLLFSQTTLIAEDTHAVRADGHAPISIMGDHTHKSGEWMLSYRFMSMNMDGMRLGDNRINLSDVFADSYTVSPEWMRMQMHMLGIMYAPSDSLTLMLMTQYTELEMRHRIFPAAPMMLTNVVGGDRFTTQSAGIGDTKLSALYTLYQRDSRKLHATLGLSLPTGSIKERDRTPRPAMPPTFNSEQLPAAMQLGSGTYDLLPALTYVSQLGDFSYGLQSAAVLRLEDENNRGYRLGNRFETSTWISYLLQPKLSVHSGLRYRYSAELKGSQNGIGQIGPNGQSVTTAFNENYGGEQLDLSIGLNYIFNHGQLSGHRLACELHLPLWQDLNGIQLETDSTITLGWQKAF